MRSSRRMVIAALLAVAPLLLFSLDAELAAQELILLEQKQSAQRKRI